MAHRRDPGQEIGLDVLAGSEHLHRLDACVVGCLDEIFALDHEQPLLLALSPRLEQPVDQPQLGIVGRRDHSSHWSQLPWKSAWPANSRSPPGQ
jgi:hypothetical protein